MSQYVIGIDLGTTNSALAYAPLAEPSPVSLFQIPQLANAGELADFDLLPSSLYIPGEKEFVEGSLALPWNAQPPFVTGRLAWLRGIENSGRLVASAKSWLSNQISDPTQPLLPLTAPEGVPKISPLDASTQYLQHLRSAWDQKHPEAKLEDQPVLITVPASFDAAARELTQRAAKLAGFPEVTILEEPQAAFYAWIERNPDWREQVKPGDLILVIDIGGGTTDFTLISVTESAGELQLERIAVGDHLLLGGDNMDLALARFAERQLRKASWTLCNFILSGSNAAPPKRLCSPTGRQPATRSTFWAAAPAWSAGPCAARSRATKWARSCSKVSSRLSIPPPLPSAAAVRR